MKREEDIKKERDFKIERQRHGEIKRERNCNLIIEKKRWAIMKVNSPSD